MKENEKGLTKKEEEEEEEEGGWRSKQAQWVYNRQHGFQKAGSQLW